MRRPKIAEFMGLFIIVLCLYPLSHYLVASTFMLALAFPYLFIAESILKYLLSLGVNGYVAIVLSATAGITAYVAAAGLIGYLFVKSPSTWKKAIRQ